MFRQIWVCSPVSFLLHCFMFCNLSESDMLDTMSTRYCAGLADFTVVKTVLAKIVVPAKIVFVT